VSKGSYSQPAPLSARERQCLQLAAEGKSIMETSQVLELSVATVKRYRTSILIKTRSGSITAALWQMVNQGHLLR